MVAFGEYTIDGTGSAMKARDHKDATDLVAHTLRGNGFDASEDGTGRGTPLVPVAFDCKGTEVQYAVDGSHPTLRSMGHSASHQNAGGHAAVAFDLRGRDGGSMPEGPHYTANIRAASGGSSRSYVAQPWAVRRLTPVECERLQGFPDDFTRIAYRGKPADKCPDGPRYKALGNSWAVNSAAWIGERIQEVEGWQ
jgi:DNA (cytosine-5)-methyltransferase 1